ncbi:MAG: NifB/NifX family molybdenum-iron cluster-binding protein [Candidatus Methanomethylophilaceae archaeon]|nr:NifB/NifX family molybdenum-iron cluster-binding protein [Candidatus Methanomethylophilaceae archaeon]
MRVVVISEGETLDSEVAEDFGHAPFFLVVDTDSLDYHVIENEFADSPEGAGVAVAKAITTLQPDAVITGGIVMHGLDILRKANIFVSYDEEGPVEQCIVDFVRRHKRNAA